MFCINLFYLMKNYYMKLETSLLLRLLLQWTLQSFQRCAKSIGVAVIWKQLLYLSSRGQESVLYSSTYSSRRNIYIYSRIYTYNILTIYPGNDL